MRHGGQKIGLRRAGAFRHLFGLQNFRQIVKNRDGAVRLAVFFQHGADGTGVVAQLAAVADIRRLIQHCAAFFDRGQATWTMNAAQGLYGTWRQQLVAHHDLPWRQGRAAEQEGQTARGSGFGAGKIESESSAKYLGGK